MARVPVVESPCPVAGKALPAGASEHCSHCDRTVHNLNRMSDRERREFMSSCSGKVCVAYTVRIPVRHRGLLTTAALAAAALVSLPVAAEGPDALGPAEPETGAMSPVEGDSGELPHCGEIDFDILGGVSQGDQAEWLDDGKDAPPDLPTIEDDGR